MNKKGFTMVELIIALGVVAVIAVIAIPAVSRYMEESDKKYNNKLVNQLEVSGKNYYSENKSELPSKTYYQTALIASTYVALPTLQSGNYVNNEFVDAEGRKCTESYVYVVQHGGSTENEYHTCLVCGEVNYTANDPYCNISNWEDKEAPDCNLSGGVVKTDENSKVVEKEGKTIYYNPTEVNITADDNSTSETIKGKIAYILIRAYENSTENKLIDESILDVSKMTNAQISTLNLMDYLPKDSNGENISARYQITVLDEGGNESTCLLKPGQDVSGGPTIVIIVDKEPPSCEILDKYECNSNPIRKYIEFDKEKTVDNWSKQEELIVLVDKTSKRTRQEMEKTPSSNRVATYTLNLEKQDSIYYGHVIDEAGNVSDCELDVKLKMCPNEKPYCFLTSENKPYTYVKRGGSTKHQAECYVYKGEKSDYNLNKIELKDKTLGTLTSKLSDDNENKENKIVIDMTFKAKDDVEGYENVILTPGVVTSQNGLVNDSLNVQTPDFYVDTKLPKITWSTNQTARYDKKEKLDWYKKGVKITATCTDTGSGMQSISKITGKGKNHTTKKVNEKTMTSTITNNAKGKNLKYSVSCTDKAGNTNGNDTNTNTGEPDGNVNTTKKYNVKEESRDKSCPCQRWKECRSKDCPCQRAKSCPSAECASWSYATGYSYAYAYSHSYCSDSSAYETGSEYCSEKNRGQIKCRVSLDGSCVTASSPRRIYKYTCWVCSGSSYSYKDKCLSRKRDEDKCGCELPKKCRTEDCGCELHEVCWHF